jgi:hypothetical protein
MENSKKAAAAMTAVTAFIKQQEAAHAAQHAPVGIPPEIYRQLYELYKELHAFFQK